jgi:hypothetical protein
MPVPGRDLEVIYLITHGWCVREYGTRHRLHDHVPTQRHAIELAAIEAKRLVNLGQPTVEVYIKTKWLRRVRDSRTYGRDNPNVPG